MAFGGIEKMVAKKFRKNLITNLAKGKAVEIPDVGLVSYHPSTNKVVLFPDDKFNNDLQIALQEERKG